MTNWVAANPPEGRQCLAHPELLRVKSSKPEGEAVIDDAIYAGTYIERRASRSKAVHRRPTKMWCAASYTTNDTESTKEIPGKSDWPRRTGMSTICI